MANDEWLVRANLRKKKNVWKIKKYNGQHTCTTVMISKNYTKLDSDMIAQI